MFSSPIRWRTRLSLSTFFLLLFRFSCSATWTFQEKDRLHYLQPDALAQVDVSAGAVVLYEKSTIDLVRGPDRGYLISDRYRRVIKITDKKALDLADYAMTYSFNADAPSKVSNVSGHTYNLVDGKMTEEKMDRKSVHDEKLNEYRRALRFSLPGVHEGSIIDFTYTIERPLLLFPAEWSFSGKYPCLYSELDCYLSKDFQYVVLAQMQQNFVDFNDKKVQDLDSTVPYAYAFSDADYSYDLIHRKWVRRMIPRMEAQPFVNNIDDYKERVMVRISAGVYAGSGGFGFLKTWEQLNAVLMKLKAFSPDEDHLQELRKMTKNTILPGEDSLELARHIFGFVRDSFTRNASASNAYLTQGMAAQLFETRTAPDGVLNLLAVNLMRAYGLKADPVILSPSDKGKMLEVYPAFDNFHQTIGQVVLGRDTFYFDASEKYLPFGILMPSYYNGYCRVVTENGGYAIALNAQRQKERSQVAFLTRDNSRDHYVLEEKHVFGAIEGGMLRILWEKDSTQLKTYLNEHIKSLPFRAKLESYFLSGRSNADTPLTLHCTYSFAWPDDKREVLQPLLYHTFGTNPFPATRRLFPVEYGSARDAYVSVNLLLPEGYSAEELPAPVKVKLDDDDTFLYDTNYDKNTHTLSLNTRFRMNRVWFAAGEYDDVRSFYEKVIELEHQSCIISKE